MKRILFYFICFLFSFSISAQSFQKDTNVIGAGLGIGGSYGSYTYNSQTPAISMFYERGVWDGVGPGTISLGGYFGFKSYKYHGSDFFGTYDYKWNYSIFGLRSAYHWNFTEDQKFDPYAGVMLGLYSLNFRSKYSYSGTPFSQPNYGGTTLTSSVYLGARYYISDNMGIYGEVGYGVSYLTLGAQIKF